MRINGRSGSIAFLRYPMLFTVVPDCSHNVLNFRIRRQTRDSRRGQDSKNILSLSLLVFCLLMMLTVQKVASSFFCDYTVYFRVGKCTLTFRCLFFLVKHFTSGLVEPRRFGEAFLILRNFDGCGPSYKYEFQMQSGCRLLLKTYPCLTMS